jgi:hypothetical protein
MRETLTLAIKETKLTRAEEVGDGTAIEAVEREVRNARTEDTVHGLKSINIGRLLWPTTLTRRWDWNAKTSRDGRMQRCVDRDCPGTWRAYGTVGDRNGGRQRVSDNGVEPSVCANLSVLMEGHESYWKVHGHTRSARTHFVM